MCILPSFKQRPQVRDGLLYKERRLTGTDLISIVVKAYFNGILHGRQAIASLKRTSNKALVYLTFA